MINLIGFSGRSGVGKTTASLYLARYYGFNRKSFAQPLKDIAKCIFPFDDIDFQTDRKEQKFKKFDWTPREFLIGLGGLIKYYNPDYLSEKMELYEGLKTVIDDVRFESDVRHVQKMGGVLVRIKRYPSQNPYNPTEDISETGLDGFKMDYTIEECENGSVLDLQRSLDRIMSDLEIKKTKIDERK